MPTPIELLLDPVSLIVLGIYATLMVWEAVAPARTLPPVANWRVRGLAAFGVFFYLSSYLPLLWDQYLIPYQLFDLSGLETVLGAVVGLLLYELGVFAWHWAMHKFDTLWLGFHQMHHSAERVDTFGAFWFSPTDMIGWTALGSLVLVLLLGVSPQSATIILLVTMFFSVFQHSNIKTPRWVGYFIQRPESHSVHHQKGVHFYNFSDLPVFDIIFGTFRNPENFADETGFYDGASSRVLEMLTFQDVSDEPNLTPESGTVTP